MRKILIRFDDICPTMDFHQFQIAMELMDKYCVKPLVGVIPDCMDTDLRMSQQAPQFWEFVKSLHAKGYTIAMHGYTHVFDSQSRGMVVNRIGSEFAGYPLEIQEEKLLKGKSILERNGIHTDIFFAPGHSYDINTLKALSNCGFRYMSDGKSPKPYSLFNVKCIPCKSGGIPRMRFGKYHTVVIHSNEWNTLKGMQCYEQFVRLLHEHHSDIVTWDEFSSVPCGNTCVQRIFERMYVQYQKYLYPIIIKLLHILRMK